MIKNQRNKEGNQHGYWKYVYNGILMYKGYWKDGEQHGYWEDYFNGILMYKGNFKNGELHGYLEMHHANGNLTKKFNL